MIAPDHSEPVAGVEDELCVTVDYMAPVPRSRHTQSWKTRALKAEAALADARRPWWRKVADRLRVAP